MERLAVKRRTAIFRAQSWILLSAVGIAMVGCSDPELQSGTRLVYELDASRVPLEPRDIATEAQEAVENRLRSSGIRPFRVRIDATSRLVVEIPVLDVAASAKVRRLIPRQADLSFHLVAQGGEHLRNTAKYKQDEKRYNNLLETWARSTLEWKKRKEANPDLAEPAPEKPALPEYIVRRMKLPKGQKETHTMVLENRPGSVVDGRFFTKLEATLDENGKPALAFRLDGEGASLLGDLTGNNVSRLLAIVLNDEIRSAPVIRSRVSTRGILAGDFSPEEVAEIASVFRSGSLPAPLLLVEERRFPKPDEER